MGRERCVIRLPTGRKRKSSSDEEQKTKITKKIFTKFEKLLDSGLGSDVLITVGKEPDIKKFQVHSILLMSVSPYFHTAFSSNWVNKVDGVIYFEKPNVSPGIFEIILNFIYKADIDLRQQNVSDICSLIKTSDELNIDILNEHLRDFVGKDSHRLISEDPVQILQIIFRLNILSSLRVPYLQIICKDPEKLMDSAKFYTLDKSTLIQIVERNDLCIEEVDIWNKLLDWATKDKLNIEEVEKWKPKDFTFLRNTLEEFIPHIRWFQISGIDFWYNVKPFKQILPVDLYDDILGYNIDKSIKPKSSTILPKRGIEGDREYSSEE